MVTMKIQPEKRTSLNRSKPQKTGTKQNPSSSNVSAVP